MTASRWKQKILAVAFSIALIALVLGLGEVLCRVFLNINLRKTSQDFVVISDEGSVVANAPNATGTSFGVTVFSDENGFRVPPSYALGSGKPEDLLVGDSVTFGVGVPEEETFAGRLRTAFPEREILNSGVVGFGIPDYVRVIDRELASRSKLENVYLFYCLNDFHSPDIYEPKSKPQSLFGQFKRSIANAFVGMNEFLGPRSKLYVLVTALVIDPASQYYRFDLQLMDVPEQRFEVVMAPLAELGKSLEKKGIKFTIILNPYEMQVRKGTDANFEAQDRIRAFLQSQGMKVLDTRDQFLALENPSEAFLFADPMHLNSLGHRLVFDTVDADLKNTLEPK